MVRYASLNCIIRAVFFSTVAEGNQCGEMSNNREELIINSAPSLVAALFEKLKSPLQADA